LPDGPHERVVVYVETFARDDRESDYHRLGPFLAGLEPA